VGANPQVVDTPLMPFAFAGETTIHCSLINGAVRDFNLMTRRGALHAQLQVLTIGRTPQTFVLSAQTLLYVASGSVDIMLGTQHITLAAQQTLSLKHETGRVQLSSSDSAQVIYIRL
jgi:uncharacterized protein